MLQVTCKLCNLLFIYLLLNTNCCLDFIGLLFPAIFIALLLFRTSGDAATRHASLKSLLGQLF